MARDRILRGVVIQAACGEDRLTLDGVFNEVFVDYQSDKLTYGTCCLDCSPKPGT